MAGLPLEDTFGDILRKAMRGTGVTAADLARLTGIATASIDAWTRDVGSASAHEARAVAAPLRLDGAKLADSALQAWYPHDPARADVHRHSQEPHPSNGYIFFLEDGKRAALVDPAGIPEHLLRIVRDGAYNLQYVLITHKHADHCDATADVAAAFPNAQIVMHELDAPAIGTLASKALHLRDGETLPFGDDAEIRMLHTPGHTDGSVSYFFKSALFTGDTLFAGSVGGAYGDVSTYDDILNSVRSKIFALPDDIAVMPGHGPPSTIAQERANNPFF